MRRTRETTKRTSASPPSSDGKFKGQEARKMRTKFVGSRFLISSGRFTKEKVSFSRFKFKERTTAELFEFRSDYHTFNS